MNLWLRRAFILSLPLIPLVLGILLGWMLHNLFEPAGSVGTVSLYKSWRVGCPALSQAKGACTMELPVADAQSGVTVASILVGHSPTGLKMEVTLPLDVLILPGMVIVVGNDKLRGYRYDTCTVVGCIASIPLDESLTTSLESAQTAKLLFAMPNSKKPVALNFALDGFSDARRAFVRNDALRESWWRRLWA